MLSLNFHTFTTETRAANIWTLPQSLPITGSIIAHNRLPGYPLSPLCTVQPSLHLKADLLVIDSKIVVITLQRRLLLSVLLHTS